MNKEKKCVICNLFFWWKEEKKILHNSRQKKNPDWNLLGAEKNDPTPFTISFFCFVLKGEENHTFLVYLLYRNYSYERKKRVPYFPFISKKVFSFPISILFLPIFFHSFPSKTKTKKKNHGNSKMCYSLLGNFPDNLLYLSVIFISFPFSSFPVIF